MQPEGSYLRLFEDTMLLKGHVCSFCTVFNLLDANGESANARLHGGEGGIRTPGTGSP
jgi:hypothetical protein